MSRKGVRSLGRAAAGLALLAGAGLAAQQPAAPSPGGAPLPAVTVRVFDGDRFVPDLGLADFEIDEAGMRVKPQALVLVNKDLVVRREGQTGPLPDLRRRVVLMFEMTEYHGKVPEALKALFATELRPADTLEIETPMRNYVMAPAALTSKPPETLARELADIVRRDILEGGTAYNSALRDLKRTVRLIGSSGRSGLGDTEGEIDDGTSLEQNLMKYADDLSRMETLRAVDESRLAAFAGRMKGLPGHKLVFLVYQREFRPEISDQTMNQLNMSNQDRPDILAALQTVFSLYHRPVDVDQARIAQDFADSGMDFQFLYMNREPERISGITMREQSEDVFRALSAAAEATGGVTRTGQNPAVSLGQAFRAADSYYLLYYTPATSAPPGTFIDLEVSVKGKDYRVSHRRGAVTGS